MFNVSNRHCLQVVQALYTHLRLETSSVPETLLHSRTLAILTSTLTVPLNTSITLKVVVNRLRLAAAAVFSCPHSDALLERLDLACQAVEYERNGRKEKIQIWSSFQELANASEDQVFRWSPMWIFRRERVVLVWAYDFPELQSAIESGRTLLRTLVSSMALLYLSSACYVRKH